MSREEALKDWLPIIRQMVKGTEVYEEALDMAIKTLQKEPCGDAVSRQAVIDKMRERDEEVSCLTVKDVRELPPVTLQQKMGRCKDCKYFEYDSVAEVHGIPLIVAHEICKRWGDGCQSKEDGYCFLFEPKTQEVEG